MLIDRLITLANAKVRLQFTAMERSLRATGCRLPLQVIPYDDRLFELPANAAWWLDRPVADWLTREGAHPTMRKYQCLTVGNYHFIDADIVFLRDPADVVAPFVGVVTSCTEWNKPQWTYTPESAAYLYRTSSTWQHRIFSTGQFAIDRPLYTRERLESTAGDPAFAAACLRFAAHEQPGLNQLVLAAGPDMTNLTLPPHRMESTWAGDYPGEYEHLWSDAHRKPYLIHWAGPALETDRPINELFYAFLTKAERAEWDDQQRAQYVRRMAAHRRQLKARRRLTFDVKRFARAVLRTVGVVPQAGMISRWRQRRTGTGGHPST